MWHSDGYDKLKPYGLPIHGCIDGYNTHSVYYVYMYYVDIHAKCYGWKFKAQTITLVIFHICF